MIVAPVNSDREQLEKEIVRQIAEQFTRKSPKRTLEQKATLKGTTVSIAVDTMSVSSGSAGNLTIEPGKNTDSALENEAASGTETKRPLVDKKTTWNLRNISELYGTFGEQNNEAIEPWEDKHNSSSDEEYRHLE